MKTFHGWITEASAGKKLEGDDLFTALEQAGAKVVRLTDQEGKIWQVKVEYEGKTYIFDPKVKIEVWYSVYPVGDQKARRHATVSMNPLPEELQLKLFGLSGDFETIDIPEPIVFMTTPPWSWNDFNSNPHGDGDLDYRTDRRYMFPAEARAAWEKYKTETEAYLATRT